MNYKYKIYYENGLDGNIVAECPAFDSCRAQGKTMEKAKERIKEIIALCIEESLEENKTIPKDVVIEEVKIAI